MIINNRPFLFFLLFQTLITKCSPECIGTPSTSRTGIPRQHYKTNTNNENKCLPSDIIEIINDPRFWTQLFELQNLLLPICGALNKLQRDVSRLYEITHCFPLTRMKNLVIA
jgi:hypothetical protein